MQTESRIVGLTRRVSFSSGHRYWKPELTGDQNKELFGSWASAYNHGHNYVLDVTVEGTLDPVTGMVVNIKDIDAILKSGIVSRFDGKSINDEVDEFRCVSPSLENLLMRFSQIILPLLPLEVRLASLYLEETPLLYGELTMNEQSSQLTVTRLYEFSAAHRLHVPSLTSQENVDLFGKCNNEAGHGHNYVLEVTVQGVINPKSGFSMELDELDRIVNEEVVDRYDHRNLNVDIPELEGKVPTSELVTLAIFDRLDAKVPGKLRRVRLHETARNVFDVCST